MWINEWRDQNNELIQVQMVVQGADLGGKQAPNSYVMYNNRKYAYDESFENHSWVLKGLATVLNFLSGGWLAERYEGVQKLLSTEGVRVYKLKRDVTLQVDQLSENVDRVAKRILKEAPVKGNIYELGLDLHEEIKPLALLEGESIPTYKFVEKLVNAMNHRDTQGQLSSHDERLQFLAQYPERELIRVLDALQEKGWIHEYAIDRRAMGNFTVRFTLQAS